MLIYNKNADINATQEEHIHSKDRRERSGEGCYKYDGTIWFDPCEEKFGKFFKVKGYQN
jgi:hypothetical protein